MGVKILNSEIEERLSRADNIWIASVRATGRPHLVPVWFVWNGKAFYICIEEKSVKGRNIAANPSVVLALEDGSSPLICEGSAEFVTPPWSDDLVKLFEQKYDWDVRSDSQYQLLVEIKPENWLTW